MDLQDAAITALSTARTEAGAVEMLQRARPDLTYYDACRALGQVVQDMGWALLAAPELWSVLEEWWACRRLEHDMAVLRDAQARLAKALEDPRTIVVVETRGGKVKARPEGLIGEIRTGPDLLSVRTSTLAQVGATLAKMERELAARRATFRECVYAHHARMSRLATMTLEEQARELLRTALLQGHVLVARELCQITGAKTAQVEPDFLEKIANRIKHVVGGST